MVRKSRGVAAVMRRHKYFQLGKTFGPQRKTFKSIKERVQRGQAFSFQGRKLKKRQYRRLWIQRLNAGVRSITFSAYEDFIKKVPDSLFEGSWFPELQASLRPLLLSPHERFPVSFKKKALLKYSRFICLLGRNRIGLNRKSLSQLQLQIEGSLLRFEDVLPSSFYLSDDEEDKDVLPPSFYVSYVSDDEGDEDVLPSSFDLSDDEEDEESPHVDVADRPRRTFLTYAPVADCDPPECDCDDPEWDDPECDDPPEWDADYEADPPQGDAELG